MIPGGVDDRGGNDMDRRGFLSRAVAALAASGLLARGARKAGAAEPPDVPPWMKSPGAGFTPYGTPSKYESKITRTFGRSQPGTTGSGAIRTPLESLEGTITPSGLHFERSHSGVPDIDPEQHRVLIHGMVERPLIFTVDALLRYPMVSRVHFLECAGNSQLMYQPSPPNLSVGQAHGLVSCSDWTGVPLRLLLEEAGVDRRAEWILAEGADAAAMSRSIPMAKAMDDAMLALFQNGERLRPENGYPVRLFLPGWEGNMSVKWLRRLKVVAAPVMTKDETSRYTDLQADGKALMFTYPMDVKSLVTQPSPGLALKGAGLYQISGIAWSGHGAIKQVEVSTDGGTTWRAARLTTPVVPRALTRFRLPWRWDGTAAVLKSRATDDAGHVQPERAAFIAEHGANAIFHYNGITAWSVAPNGEVKHVYA
jgi:sulfane dehydrogenase subunit SoxC